MRTIRRIPAVWRPLLLLPVLLIAACSGSHELAAPVPPRLERVQSQTRDGVTVEVTIPTADQISAQFGVRLADFDIQPIWLRMANTGPEGLWFIPVAVDPEYYSASEVAAVAGDKLADDAREALRARLIQAAIPLYVPSGGSIEGYVYASLHRGGRFVDVRLLGHATSVRLRFAVLLPESGLDYHKSRLGERYGKLAELPDLGPDELRRRLQALPCCTTNADGSANGDPLNVVLIGRGEYGIAALLSSGWDFTEAISMESIRKMVGAAIEENRYLTAPVSSLYLFDREQDAALQRGRSTISQRNHMRLWLAPFRYEGMPVWIGQVSRDAGVKLTTKSASFTTHVIDPAVDEAREYVFQSLLQSEAVRRFGFVNGVGACTPDDPRYNLTGDPYFTDGKRLVVFLSQEPVAPEQADNLRWEEATDPIRVMQGEEGKVPLREHPPE